jgi:hypothetical protein
MTSAWFECTLLSSSKWCILHVVLIGYMSGSSEVGFSAEDKLSNYLPAMATEPFYPLGSNGSSLAVTNPSATDMRGARGEVWYCDGYRDVDDTKSAASVPTSSTGSRGHFNSG